MILFLALICDLWESSGICLGKRMKNLYAQTTKLAGTIGVGMLFGKMHFFVRFFAEHFEPDLAVGETSPALLFLLRDTTTSQSIDKSTPLNCLNVKLVHKSFIEQCSLIMTKNCE